MLTSHPVSQSTGTALFLTSKGVNLCFVRSKPKLLCSTLGSESYPVHGAKYQPHAEQQHRMGFHGKPGCALAT